MKAAELLAAQKDIGDWIGRAVRLVTKAARLIVGMTEAAGAAGSAAPGATGEGSRAAAALEQAVAALSDDAIAIGRRLDALLEDDAEDDERVADLELGRDLHARRMDGIERTVEAVQLRIDGELAALKSRLLELELRADAAGWSKVLEQHQAGADAVLDPALDEDRRTDAEVERDRAAAGGGDV